MHLVVPKPLDYVAPAAETMDADTMHIESQPHDRGRMIVAT
jgi:hypothetical protein